MKVLNLKEWFYEKNSLWIVGVNSFSGGTIIPLTTVHASEIENSQVTSNTVQLGKEESLNNISDNVEIIEIDQFGKAHTYNPHMRFSSSIVYIGVKMKYTSKADGKKLIGVLNQSYGMGTMGDAIQIFSTLLGGIPGSVVGSFVGAGFKGFRNRCKESISEIKAHPSKGAIYMYLDRVEWKTS